MHPHSFSPIRGRTITRDLVFWLTGSIMVILSSIGIWYQLYSTTLLEQKLQQEADTLTEEIGGVLTLPMQELNDSTVESIAQTYLNVHHHVVGIEVQTDFGESMFSRVPPSPEKYLYRKKTLLFKEMEIGTVHLWFSDFDLQQARQETIKTGMLISSLIILIVMFGTFLFMRFWLSRPLAVLIQGIRRLAQGDSKPLPPAPQAEIAAITHEVNKMAAEILQQKVKLEESERKYRSIFENAAEGIFQADASGRFITANSSMATILGYASAQELLEGISNISQQLYVDASDRQELFSRLDRHGVVTRFETQVYKKDGQIIWVALNVRSIRDKQGETRIVEGLLEDITEQRQMRDTLAAEKERLSVTLNSIGDGVVSTDTDGRIVMLNRVAEQLTGWNHTEAVGEHFEEVFQLVDMENRAPRESPITEVVRSGQIVDLKGNTMLVARDGTERLIADSGAPIRDKHSRIVGVVLVFRDVTEKRKIEEDLIKARKLESVGLLAGGIAHDFNNILVAILGNINLAMLKVATDDPLHKLLTEAEKASLRAKDLTQQLLTFSKGGEPVKKISSIIEVIKDSAEFILRGSNVRCNYRFADDLWPAEIDTGQISQVIQNLILNADHAMPQGGVIDVHCDNFTNEGPYQNAILPVGHYVRILIKDRGVGIPPHAIDKIFDPYFSTKQKGSGLGLSVTHSIVSKHGGAISVESEIDQGTAFTILLPASPTAFIEPVAKETRESKVTGRQTILIMDDEEIVRNVAAEMLTTFGYTAIQAKDGEEAIALYRKSMEQTAPIDLIVMDLTIPGGMGGKEAIKKILALNKDAKVIVASGYSNDPVMSDYRRHGFAGVIAKPFQLDQLRREIDAVLGQ